MKNKKFVKKSVLLKAFREATKEWEITDYITYRDLCNVMIKALNGDITGGLDRFIEEEKGVIEYTIRR